MSILLREEEIKKELAGKFSGISASLKIARARRIFAEVNQEEFMKVFSYVAKDLGFSHLCTITGLDEQDRFSFLYHLAQDSGIILNLKTSVSKENPTIKTVTSFFAGADIYERELMDLFGIKVEGLTSGSRYPLPDDWPVDQFPLRKDWHPQEGREEGENNHA